METLKIEFFSFAGDAIGVCKGVEVLLSKLFFLVIESFGLY
jgi:hypothetical protein